MALAVTRAGTCRERSGHLCVKAKGMLAIGKAKCSRELEDHNLS